MGRRSRKHRPAGAAAAPRAPRRSAEERNAEIRAQLEPYAPGEHPWPLTAGAIVAAAAGIGNLIAFAAGVEVSGSHAQSASLPGILVLFALLLAMAYGMWTKRYWAVLGFQTLLAITVVGFFLLLLRASSLLAVAIAVTAITLLGWLFWRLVRVLARIQTPERPGARR